jgi:hypothetical protein
MLFFKNLHYRKLQTPEVAFTAMALIMMLLVVVYFADPKQHRWIASGRSAACSHRNSPNPRCRLFSRTSSPCVRVLSTAATRCCPRFWPSASDLRVVVADLGRPSCWC